jgi:hypothetical protein
MSLPMERNTSKFLLRVCKYFLTQKQNPEAWMRVKVVQKQHKLFFLRKTIKT